MKNMPVEESNQAHAFAKLFADGQRIAFHKSVKSNPIFLTYPKVHQYKDNEWLVLPYFEEKSGDVVGIHRILFSDLKTKRDLGDKRGLLVEGRDSKPCIAERWLA